MIEYIKSCFNPIIVVWILSLCLETNENKKLRGSINSQAFCALYMVSQCQVGTIL